MTDEGTMVGEYRQGVIFTPCDCDGPGILSGLVINLDGKITCSSCGKGVKIERYILMGCARCTPKKLKELDELEKDVYGTNGISNDKQV
jgi:hypothetical protein